MRKYLLILLLLTSCTPGTRFILHEDNDILKLGKTDDRNFSQGIKLSADIPDDTGSQGYSVGQNFYTPGHKQNPNHQPNDRPYAGFLYGEALFKYRTSESIQDTIGFTAGIVGPHSYAEQTQNEFHRFLDQHTAKGWEHQIDDELGLMLTLERAVGRSLIEDSDVIGVGGVNLGNVFTQAYLGATFRWGYNLPGFFDHSIDIVYPRMPHEIEEKKLSAYLFAGPYARLVARNIFLDGNTFHESAHIDKEPFVAEGRAGFAVRYTRYQLAYTYVIQTHEFEGQEDGVDFGEVTLGFEF